MQLFIADWEKFLIGEEAWEFLIEVTLRSTIMFSVVLASLKIMGRRAVMQGIFEVALIISLGSAAGDAMFYSKVGLLPALLVFLVIVLLYRLLDFLMAKSRRFEKFIDGAVIPIIENGAFIHKKMQKGLLSEHEIFADLRLENVSHLGQVKKGYIEPNGKMSVFFFSNEEVKYGLPILPENSIKKNMIDAAGYYSCAFCGDTNHFAGSALFRCRVCEKDLCVKSSNEARVH